MKRILIDGRFIGVGESISRYTLETLKGILKIDKENEYTLLIRPVGEKRIDDYPEIINAPNLKIDILDIPHYSVAEQTKLLKYLNQNKYDLVHFTQFNHPVLYRGNFVVTIHDLTLVGHLHYHNLAKKIAYNMVMKHAATKSKKVIAISQNCMDDVVEYFGIKKDKFKVIYHGIDHANYNTSIQDSGFRIQQFKEKYGIKGDYILYTGMWKKHKNLIRMFKAFEKYVMELSSVNDQLSINGQLSSNQLETDSCKVTENCKLKTENCVTQLVLTGKVDKNEPEVIAEMERINKSVVRRQSSVESQNHQPQATNDQLIITTGFILENELPIAYAGASLYIIPSLSEGFGWPPLEAMACGTPVISSNISCMPEILGDAPCYVDPYDINDIAKAISEVLSDNELRANLVRKGLERVKLYDWNKTACETFLVYKNCF